MGITVYAPYEDENACNTKYVDFKGYRVKSFELPHDGTKNYGFLIACDGMKILYMTDFEYCGYIFTKLNIDHIIVECNYIDDLVSEDAPNFKHKILGHCSLDTCKEFIKTNYTENLQNVILIHLSDQTSDPDRMIAEIKEVTDSKVNVDYARCGFSIDLQRKE